MTKSLPDIQWPGLQAAPETTGGWARPILTRHVADDVVDRLVTAVALGLFVPGEQLPTERDLSGMLAVSRSSARDALKRLTDDGYLEVRRGRAGGYFVRADWGPASVEHVRRHLIAHWTEFESIFDARNLIEPLIARTASERRDESDIAAMQAALADYVAAADHDASRKADSNLHLAIARATGNHILQAISLDLRARISLNLGAEPYTDEVRRVAITEHTDLVAAIRNRDTDAAGAIAGRHFRLSERLIRELAARAGDDSRSEGG